MFKDVMPGWRPRRIDDVEPHLLELDVSSKKPHIGGVPLDASPDNLRKTDCRFANRFLRNFVPPPRQKGDVALEDRWRMCCDNGGGGGGGGAGPELSGPGVPRRSNVAGRWKAPTSVQSAINHPPQLRCQRGSCFAGDVGSSSNDATHHSFRSRPAIMKLTAALLAAFAGCAAAAQPAAEVFLVPTREWSSSSPKAPSLSRSLARLVLLQRLAPIGQGPSIHDIPAGADIDAAVSAMNTFGKPPPALFADGGSEPPSQLVMLLEGLTEEQIKSLGKDFKTKPAFTIADPPSSAAHDELIRVDLKHAAVSNNNKCSAQQIVNPLEECWGGKQAAIAKFDVKKDPEILKQVTQKLVQLSKLAKSGELETAIVLLPSTAASKSWADESQELRRRQAEQVMTSLDRPEQSAPPSSPNGQSTIFTAKGPIAACFNSKDSCIKATGNCSEHGSCLNKYANEDGSDGKQICYACHCLSTRTQSGSLTHWAGPTCSKSDISAPFWLFAGFTLAMVGILWLAISMLFNVGEEKLPGVIGAGVSRSK
ncbi:arsenate reductase [Purpureocillium lavendulum]|uniref:Arsenate reductase n=1 Tax=Purpureocillium lavendulum TaxID=1247861 RepID=A0AB34FXT0_9HYPO|nr:arsenate reductase [Purpureocillium lavendulum]